MLKAVWPSEVVAKLPWRDIVWVNPDQRLLAFNRDNEIICHVAIVLRDATWDGSAGNVGGIGGGVATREDSRLDEVLLQLARLEIDRASPPRASGPESLGRLVECAKFVRRRGRSHSPSSASKVRLHRGVQYQQRMGSVGSFQRRDRTNSNPPRSKA